MIPLLDLWLPILVAAVAVFLTSSVLQMVLTYHRREYRALPQEAEALDALRRSGPLTPGLYVFPHCPSAKEMASPEMRKKYEQGPVGMMSVFPNGTPNMGKSLGLWFVFCALVSAFVAYLAGRTLVAGAPAEAVCRFVAPAAFLAYGLSELISRIWKGQTWSYTLKLMFDGLVYSLVTGAVFAWLWPH